MFYFNCKPSIGIKVKLLQKLKRSLETRMILRPRIEENYIVSICNDLGIRGGGLVFGKKQPEYLLCFLDQEDYSPENISLLDQEDYSPENISLLEQAIRREFPDVKDFDIVSAARIYD